MSLWPRSFFARNLLLIVGMFGVAQFASWALFAAMVQRPRIERFAPYVSAQTTTLRLALQDRTPAERTRFLAAVQQQSGGTLRVMQQPPAGLAPPSELLVRWFFELLRPRLGPGEALAWQGAPERMLWVKVPVQAQDYWVGFSAEGFVLELTDAALAVLAVSVLLALLGAWLIRAGLIRPLRALETAALRVGEGAPQPQVRASMPLELERVARSFNTMAERLDARDSERALMLAGISHDLRTPLTKLWLGVEMLDGHADAELLARMTRSVEAASRIIEQFIDFARDDAEPVQDCDVRALLQEVAHDTLGGAAQISLAEGAAAICLARPQALRRMLANLLENARRHGLAPVAVRVDRQADMLTIEIVDHGPGVPVAALATLTQPFVRLDAAQAATHGTGLGLAIVERLARAHGGSLELDNAPHAGLRARLRLQAPVA